MGVNLFVIKIVNKSYEETYSGLEPYYETVPQDWFDHLRYSGDRDFILENEFVFIDSDLEERERRLARPKDFENIITWVKENVFTGNQQRLLDLIEKIKEDQDLCFMWSF